MLRYHGRAGTLVADCTGKLRRVVDGLGATREAAADATPKEAAAGRVDAGADATDAAADVGAGDDVMGEDSADVLGLELGLGLGLGDDCADEDGADEDDADEDDADEDDEGADDELSPGQKA